MIGSFLLLILSAYLFLQSPYGQNWLTQQIIGSLSKQWQTKIALQRARFSLFDRLQLEGLTVYDDHQDTILYAGKAQAQITNWFFLRSQNELGPTRLETIRLKLQRNDSVWRHEKLWSRLQGSGGSSSGRGTAHFNFNEIEILQARVDVLDGWTGMNATAVFDQFLLEANRLDPNDSIFDIRTIFLKNPSVYVEAYPGNRPTKPRTKFDFFSLDPFWSGPIGTVNKLQIENASLTWREQGERLQPGRLNPAYMKWEQLQLRVSGLRSSADSVSLPFDISGKEACGLEIKKLTGTAWGKNAGWGIDDLSVVTNQSELRQDIGLTRSVNGTTLMVSIEHSSIAPADLYKLTGKSLPLADPIRLRGTIQLDSSQIRTSGLWAEWGSGVRISGDLTGSGWRDEQNWAWTFDRAELFARASPVLTWLSIAPSQLSVLSKLGFAQFRGGGKLTPEKAIFNGQIRTQLGTLTANGSVQYPQGETISYQASLSGELQGVSSLLPNSGIRSTQLTISVLGKGLQTIQATGLLNQLQTDTYRFAPIRFALEVTDPQWDLSLTTQDPHLSGVIQLGGEPFSSNPLFELDARLDWMDFTALGWNEDGLTLKGSLHGQFSGDNLQQLSGSLQGHSLELARNSVPLSLQEFNIRLEQNGSLRSLSLESNELEASIQGKFSWDALPSMALQVGHQFFPALIKAPDQEKHSEAVEFALRSYNVESYLELVHLPVSGLSNADISGSWQFASGRSQLKASLPRLQIGSYALQGISVEANGTHDSLQIVSTIQKIQLNDSLNIPEARIELSAHRDTADIRLVAGVSQATDKADIRSRLIAYADGLRLDLAPSTFLVQGKVWSIDENGQLLIRKGEPVLGNISMREGNQRIDLRTIPAKNNQNNDIEISLESINLHDIASFFFPAQELEGLVSARIRLVDPTGNIQLRADTIQTRLLRFENDSIGEIGARLAFDPSSQRLTATGETLNKKEHLTLEADVRLQGSADSNRILLKANAYPIDIVERFLGELFSDIRGKLTGEVEILGDLNNPSLYGRGKLIGAGLRVKYTNCFYTLQDADIDLTPTLIDLDGWVLKDSVTGNPILIRGGIAHESFRNMFFDLSATTRSLVTNSDRPVLLLNTNRSQGEVYYGTARGTLALQLRGPQTNLIMNLQAKASDRDSSYITLLSEDGRVSGDADFLIEREYGREMTGSNKLTGADNFTVDMEITATPMVNAKVVLDELTGDVIRGRGSGTLKLRSGSNEPLTLRGRYNIDEGNYLFTFQSFFKKPFEIRKGGQHYLEWSGDPYDANLKIEAVYRAENVSFAPLASSLNLGNGLNNARGDIFVNAELSGKLFQPQIRFSLAFPTNSVVDRNQELALLVNQLQKNPNELNRQVTYLIVFNSFAPSELAGDPIGSGIGVSTISGVLLNVLSDQINKLLGNLLKSDKYTINLNTSLYNRDWMAASNNALNLGSNINFSVGRSFFNNRFIISGGLGFDAPLGQSSTNANLSQSIQLLPDVTMEWLLNPSGSLRVGFFYRKSNDFLTNNTNPITARRAGGSLSYQKDYDHLGDLFRGLFRKKKKPVGN